ncbi:MAG: SDR family NAD(P)-dependent oxidoreductase, partial [Planctomycetes bacterium]|nr:SDR family NAD(P)-dependent oxidoreductase [Planctomycetota bacterium]
MKIKNRTVWITGASSGIGEALALEMAPAGARLLLSARRVERLAAVAKACRRRGAARVEELPLDIADTAALRPIAAAADAR